VPAGKLLSSSNMMCRTLRPRRILSIPLKAASSDPRGVELCHANGFDALGLRYPKAAPLPDEPGPYDDSLSQQGIDAISAFTGVYHMTAAGKTSWFEFAKAILKEASRVAPGIPWFKAAPKGQPLITGVHGTTTAEYPTQARRPAYSVLSNFRLRQVFALELPDWSSQLRAVFAEGRMTKS